MIVWGVNKKDEGKELFAGDLEECWRYVKEELKDLSGFYSVNICKDNGEIEERILKPQQPIYY